MATSPAVKEPNARLGAMLVEGGVISEGQLTEALGSQDTGRGFLGSVLVDLGFLKEHVLINFLVKQCKIPHINLMDYSINKDLMQLVPKEICIDNSLIPIDKLGRILTIAMVDPLDQVALELVREACPDMRVKPILCSWHHYDNVIRKIYPEETKRNETATAETFGLPPIKSEANKPEPPKATQQAAEQEAPAAPPPEAPPEAAAPVAAAPVADAPVAAAPVAAAPVAAVLVAAAPEPAAPATAAPVADAPVADAPVAAAPVAAAPVAAAPEPAAPATAAPVTATTARPPSNTSISPAATAFLGLVNVSVKRAMEEAFANLTDRVLAFIGETQDLKLPVSSAVFVETLREAIAQATDDAVGTLLYETQEALSQSKTAATELSVDDLSRLLRASMRTALQDASVDVLKMAAEALIATNPDRGQT